MRQALGQAGLPDGVLNVVPGPGAVIGSALARHPGVDKITFTGSTEVGKSLLRAVGETDVKAITLELGGKSPAIIAPDFPGFGGSDARPGASTMQVLAADALSLLGRLRVERANGAGLEFWERRGFVERARILERKA